MNIGIDIRPLQEAEPSGVGEYTYELLRALFAIDKENQYHLFANAKGEVTLPSFDAPNITLHRFHYPNKLLNLSMCFLDSPKIDRLIHTNTSKGDGRQLSTIKQLGTLDALFMPNLNFIALGKRIPLVVTAHDLSFELYPSFFTKKQRLWHNLIKPRTLLERATQVIAVSEYTKNDLVHRYGLTQNGVHVIHPGISPLFFAPTDNATDAAVRRKYNLPTNFILFLATVEPRKNPDAIIEAFTLLKEDPQFRDLHLVLAGKKSNLTPLRQRRIRLQRKTSKLSDVHFLGYIPKTDRPSLYRLARTFVYPSYYEGFGLPPLEAMSQGTPVIASHASSLGEVLDDAALLVDPHNIEDLRLALREVLTDSTLATDLATRGREHAKQFTWDRAAKETLSLFHNISTSNV